MRVVITNAKDRPDCNGKAGEVLGTMVAMPIFHVVVMDDPSLNSEYGFVLFTRNEMKSEAALLIAEDCISRN
jgi:hypothetical protein